MTGPTTTPESFQIPLDIAERYEALFVPAFFAQWSTILCAVAAVGPGDHVLDVACGTGIVARTAADLVGPEGRVVGLDANEAMLTVARRVRPELEWRLGDAGAMPLPDEAFDVVLCQMAMMFFPDRVAALREMARTARSGGTIAVLVPGRLDAQEAFAPFVAMAADHAGPEAMALLGTYFDCGDLEALSLDATAAGLVVAQAVTQVGTYRAPSVDAFVATEVESTPLRARITDDVYRNIREGAQRVLAPFTRPDGSVVAPFLSNVLTARGA